MADKRRSRLLPVLGAAALRLWTPVGCGVLHTDVFKKPDVKARAVRWDQEPITPISGWALSRVLTLGIEMKGAMTDKSEAIFLVEEGGRIKSSTKTE